MALDGTFRHLACTFAPQPRKSIRNEAIPCSPKAAVRHVYTYRRLHLLAQQNHGVIAQPEPVLQHVVQV